VPESPKLFGVCGDRPRTNSVQMRREKSLILAKISE